MKEINENNSPIYREGNNTEEKRLMSLMIKNSKEYNDEVKEWYEKIKKNIQKELKRLKEELELGKKIEELDKKLEDIWKKLKEHFWKKDNFDDLEKQYFWVLYKLNIKKRIEWIDKIHYEKNNEVISWIERLKKLNEQFWKKIENIYNSIAWNEDKIKEITKKLYERLDKELSKDERKGIISILKVIKWENVSDLFVIKNENNYIFNSWNKKISAEELVHILPNNFEQIKVWENVYSKVKNKNWEILFLDNNWNILELKTWDIFSVLKTWNSFNRDLQEKEASIAIKQLIVDNKDKVKDKVDEINKKYRRENEKKYNVWDFVSDSFEIGKVVTEWLFWSWKEKVSLFFSSVSWLLELISWIIQEIFWQKVWNDIKEGTPILKKIISKNEKSSQESSEETETRFNGENFKEVIFVGSTKKLEKIKEQKEEWLPENIRKIDWKYVRIDIFNTIPLKWHDLWEYLYKNKNIKSVHAKYIPEILKIEKKLWIPAEVLINLIYHENPEWNEDEQKKSWWAYGLWQFFSAAWKDAIKFWEKKGIHLPENMKEATPEEQLWATALYLKTREKLNWNWNWILATVAYNSWNLNITDEQAKKFFIKNPPLRNKLWEREENRKNYIIASIAFYYDLPFNEAEKLYRKAPMDYKKILHKKFKEVKLKIWQEEKETMWTYLDLNKYDNIELKKGEDMHFSPIFKNRLENAFEEINQLLKNYPYKIKVTSWFRTPWNNSWAKQSAHLAWLAIDFHLVDKNWEWVWETENKWNETRKVYSRLLEQWEEWYKQEAANIRKRIVDIMKNNWMYWWWDFYSSVDAMHFNLEERQKYAKEIYKLTIWKKRKKILEDVTAFLKEKGIH